MAVNACFSKVENQQIRFAYFLYGNFNEIRTPNVTKGLLKGNCKAAYSRRSTYGSNGLLMKTSELTVEIFCERTE